MRPVRLGALGRGASSLPACGPRAAMGVEKRPGGAFSMRCNEPMIAPRGVSRLGRVSFCSGDPDRILANLA
jgi:hypothetical protein